VVAVAEACCESHAGLDLLAVLAAVGAVFSARVVVLAEDAAHAKSPVTVAARGVTFQPRRYPFAFQGDGVVKVGLADEVDDPTLTQS